MNFYERDSFIASFVEYLLVRKYSRVSKYLRSNRIMNFIGFSVCYRERIIARDIQTKENILYRLNVAPKGYTISNLWSTHIAGFEYLSSTSISSSKRRGKRRRIVALNAVFMSRESKSGEKMKESGEL